MTITNTVSSTPPFTGNGVTTAFPFTFLIPDAASLFVKTQEIATGLETPIASSAYSVTGLGSPAGGSVTYPLTGSLLASSHKLIIYRDIAPTQTVNITNQTTYFADVAMGVWDRIVMMVQELVDSRGRSLRSPVGDITLNDLPTATNRAGGFLAFDGAGQPITATTIGSSAVSTFMSTVLDDADAPTARATLGTGTAAQGALAETALQSVLGDTTPQLGGTLDTNGELVQLSEGTPVASGSTVTLPTDGNIVHITGTTSIARFTDRPIGTIWRIIADNGFSIIDGVNISCPNGLNLVLRAGDSVDVRQSAATVVTLENLTRADGVGNLGTLIVQDEKGPLVDGQLITANVWTVRDLNTVVENTLAESSLASNQVTLPAGKRSWDIVVPAFQVNAFVAELWDVTNSVQLGLSNRGNSHASGYAGDSVVLRGATTLSASTVVEVRMTAASTAATGGGEGRTAGTIGSTLDNIYTIAQFW